MWGFLVESNDCMICSNFAKLYKVAHEDPHMDNCLSALWEIQCSLVPGAPFSHIFFLDHFCYCYFFLQLELKSNWIYGFPGHFIGCYRILKTIGIKYSFAPLKERCCQSIHIWHSWNQHNRWQQECREQRAIFSLWLAVQYFMSFPAVLVYCWFHYPCFYAQF